MAKSNDNPVRNEDVLDGLRLTRKISTKSTTDSDAITQTIHWNFDGMTVGDCLRLAEKSLRISYQSKVRSMEFPEKYMKDNPEITVNWLEAGKKVLTTDELVGKIKASGIDLEEVVEKLLEAQSK